MCVWEGGSPRIMGAMGAAQAAYGQAGLPAGAPAVELVVEITQPLKTHHHPPHPPAASQTPPRTVTFGVPGVPECCCRLEI